jgi:hypothetical protein
LAKKKYIYFKYSSTSLKKKCGAAEEWWATDPKNVGYIPACVFWFSPAMAH